MPSNQHKKNLGTKKYSRVPEEEEEKMVVFFCWIHTKNLDPFIFLFFAFCFTKHIRSVY